jgi:hypothetical protein
VGGTARIDMNKECTGNGQTMADGTFEALCIDPVVFLQNNSTFDRVIGYVEGSILTIVCENQGASNVVNWMVIAERKDPSIRENKYTDADGRLVLEHDDDRITDEENAARVAEFMATQRSTRSQ